MGQTGKTAIIEAILFFESDPIELKTLEKITNFSRDTVLKSLESIKLELQRECHGIELVEVGGGYCFAPKKSLWVLLRQRYGKKNGRKLSRAAIETLAIIAYSQPITKAEIESMRGVAADGMIRQLLDNKLVRVTGKKDSPGRPVQYGTSKDFLIRFNLKSIADLPRLDELEQDRFETYVR